MSTAAKLLSGVTDYLSRQYIVSWHWPCIDWRNKWLLIGWLRSLVSPHVVRGLTPNLPRFSCRL